MARYTEAPVVQKNVPLDRKYIAVMHIHKSLKAGTGQTTALAQSVTCGCANKLHLRELQCPRSMMPLDLAGMIHPTLPLTDLS